MYKSMDGDDLAYHQAKKARNCCCRHVVTILVCFGLFFVIGGIVCAVTNVFEDWVKDEIRDGVKLKEGNEVYDKWRDPENPTYLTYYMFNVTNPDNVSKGGIPIVHQCGPYTYRLVPNITVIGRNKYASSSITYLSQKHHIFERKLSCKNCDPSRDFITNANIPFMTTVEMVVKYIKLKDPKSLSYALRVLDQVFVKLDLQDFHTHAVHELLWGYKDDKLNEAHGILTRLVKSRDPTFNIDLPTTFALQENKSLNMYTIDSGVDDVDNVGEYLLWNKHPNITCWNDKYANMMNGSGGLHYKPFLSKDDTIYALVTPVYRSFTLIYDSTVEYRGIHLYRFALTPEQFVSGDVDGNNKGFCPKGKKCPPSGIMDLTHCDPSHAPVVASLPHFYMGNKSLLRTVKGLHPQKYVHGTFLDIEPHTGLTMRGHRRMQINAKLRKIEGITAFQNTSKVYLPVFYGDKHAHISEEDADDFKHDVLLPLRFSQAAPFALLGLGSILLLVAGVISFRRHHRRDGTSDERLPLVLSSGNSFSEYT
ncbi:lysosome membrane protein 2-like isoform X2 [Dendronephthya gigantea]|uniref:lysosome membrane protein 2-like isoform X2 n=1 Tax=Dendronephthya gigantea TaxID=151771 RepID=UPI00106C94D6|nr:lysosome membrane protein 2-like isoform X2 [Dendronephthya gigantea]